MNKTNFIELKLGNGTLVSNDTSDEYINCKYGIYCLKIKTKGFLIYKIFPTEFCLKNNSKNVSPNLFDTIQFKNGRGLLMAKYNGYEKSSTFFFDKNYVEETIAVINEAISKKIISSMFNNKLKVKIIPELNKLNFLV